MEWLTKYAGQHIRAGIGYSWALEYLHLAQEINQKKTSKERKAGKNSPP
jgi:hypothetical protein